MALDAAGDLATPLAILREACQRFGYQFRITDTWSHRLVEVSDGRRSFLAGTDRISVYPLNSAVAVAVAQDKAHTYNLLQQRGYRIPRTGHFFITDEYRDVRPPGREIEDALRFVNDLGYPVFVKPNQGSFARNAGPAYDETELRAAFDRIATKDYSAIVQEFVSPVGRCLRPRHADQPASHSVNEAPLSEYRVFMLDGVVRFAYRKTRGTLTGDGRSSVEDLARRAAGDQSASILGSIFLRQSLERGGLAIDGIMPLGQTLEFTPVANLAAGGQISEFYTSVPDAAQRWVQGIAEAIGLRLLGVDAFFPDGLGNPHSALVLDVNGSPTLTSVYRSGRQELALEIWRDIIEAAL